MSHHQEKVFITSEADNWFIRNKEYIGNIRPESDSVLNFLKGIALQPGKILEIGCSNGFRLKFLKDIYKAECYGIEPSALAVEDSKTLQGIIVEQGSAKDLGKFGDDTFDLVIVNFVMHWIDRAFIYKVISEIDRVLVDKGFLLIGDFEPAQPVKVTYHHNSSDGQVYTYKQNYYNVLLSSNMYTMVKMESYMHDKNIKADYSNYKERCCNTLLLKDRFGLYNFQ